MIIFNRLVEHKLDDVYGAIADPTRRAILAMLANGEVNVGKVVDQFSISFNGVSKHVKVLERAGLIERTVVGREHRLRLNPKPLRDAAQWLDHYREFWEIDGRFSHCLWLFQHNGGVFLPPWGKAEQWMLSVQHRPEDVDSFVSNFEGFSSALRS